MALADLVWQVPLVIIGGYSGLAFHELCHYAGGWLFGGQPKFQRYWFGIPTQVDFLSPGSMTDAQIRVTGGIVALWPLLTLGTTGYIVGTQRFGLVPVIVFFGGASGVSWTDLLAAYDPQLWRRFTEGEAISRKDLQ